MKKPVRKNCRPLAYGEPTTTMAFRVPISKVGEFRLKGNRILKSYKKLKV